MLRNQDENKWLDPHFVPEGRHENSPAMNAGIRVNTAHRVPEGRMNIGMWSTIFPGNQLPGYVRMLLTEQLQSQVLCFDDDCVTSDLSLFDSLAHSGKVSFLKKGRARNLDSLISIKNQKSKIKNQKISIDNQFLICMMAASTNAGWSSLVARWARFRKIDNSVPVKRS